MREGHSWSGRERHRAFLNCGDGRFADVSAVTGLDFLDDGRAFGVVDWDHDGDLDLWLHNRTGPRLRLMLNRTDTYASDSSWVQLRLRGTEANRDGIGARVEVVVSGDDTDERRVQVVYAGDGFQSQSSKWLHFGLGRLQPGQAIERVQVRWPVADEQDLETFTAVQANGRYLLEQGTGVAVAVATRDSSAELKASGQASPPAASDARPYLPRRVPLPELPYLALEEGAQEERRIASLVEAAGGPVLVNLWASWCMPCLTELRELGERRPDLEAAGLEVLALTVEGLDEKETRAEDSLQVLRSLGFSGPAGAVSVEMLDKLDLLEQILYELDLPFVVPVSYLLDRDGRLAAVYRGRVEVEELLQDVRSLDTDTSDRHRRSAPLAGRWHSQVSALDMLWVGRVFRDRYPDDMESYLVRAVEQFDHQVERAETQEIRTYLKDRAASALVDLALASRARGDVPEAMARLRRALDRKGDMTLAHLNLGELLRDAGRHEESLQHYGLAYKSDPENAVARHGLGMAFYALGDVDNALGHLSAAHHFAPDMPAPIQGMAWILIRHAAPGDQRATRDALDLARRGVELTEYRDARMLDVLAAALARAGLFAEAQEKARDALELAKTTESSELTAEIAGRLAAYEEGRPGG